MIDTDTTGPNLDGFTFRASFDPSLPLPSGWAESENVSRWHCVIGLGEETFETPFFMGPALTAPPTLAEVIEALASDAAAAQDPDELIECGLSYTEVQAVIEQSKRFEAFLGPRFDRIVYPDFSDEEG